MVARELIGRVEAADPVELARILNSATPTDERILEDYLGPERYRRMKRLATRVGAGPGPESRGLFDFLGAARPTQSLGNVVLLPGIMGSELSVSAELDASSMVWLSLWRIARGQVGRLRLARNGSDEFEVGYRVEPTGILKKYYGEMALSLARSWNVKTFWYDWRKDLDLAADSLHAYISRWFPRDAPVHLVAHSMGGLVSRTFIQRYPQRWSTMWDAERNGARGGRLVMLGTPNQGSFLVPQMVTGLASTMQKLAMLDLTRDLGGILEVLNTFVGAWQMLPSLAVVPEAEPLYDARTFGDLNINQRHLDNAAAHHKLLADVVEPARMIYVAGFGQATHARIKDYKRVRFNDAYEMTMQGDGSVPHSLGLLDGLTTYYVKSEHSALTSNATVLGSLDTLLLGGSPSGLSGGLPVHRGEDPARESETAAQEMASRQEREIASFGVLLTRMRSRNLGMRGGVVHSEEGEAEPIEQEPQATETERLLEEELVRGFLSPSDEDSQKWVEPNGAASNESIELALVLGSIQDIDHPPLAGPPVDVIAIGHYLGVRPAGVEFLLDQAISAGFPGGGGLILTEFTDRNILRGQLAQPFFLDDPRRFDGPSWPAGGRLIALPGMGRPGTFGVPEQVVLARELCWSLGRMGRKHMASNLIGAGRGNISHPEAVDGWLSGIAEAVAVAAHSQAHRLERVTIVENDPERILEIDEAIRRSSARPDVLRKAKIDYKGLQILLDRGDPTPFPTINEKSGRRIRDLVQAKIENRYRKALDAIGSGPNLRESFKAEGRHDAGMRDATRLSVEFRPIHGPIVGVPPTSIPVLKARYIYSAITENASVPEREIIIDPKLIEEANDKLPAQSDPAKQFEIGRALSQLLLPDDLALHLSSQAPLVLTVDATTARVHWEMLAQPINLSEGSDYEPRSTDRERSFLGTCRTLTRQFRTSFANLPAPPRATRREIRVLIVADPAGGVDALLGAREEGLAIAELFERFNARPTSFPGRRVVVESLIGPGEATRFDVISRLLNEQYDVMHFAGHCYFYPDDPAASGWIFDKRQILSANEMRRIKQVPRFIFSNACESGITPDRSGDRSDQLAPSFAEAFFSQGVANFVCTAWPVDDATALRFARRFYSSLLGFDPSNANANPDPLSMHRAMQEARLEVIKPPNDTRTWGAYQHYGNPHFRFFDPITAEDPSHSPTPDREEVAAKRPEPDGTEAKSKRASRPHGRRS